MELLCRLHPAECRVGGECNQAERRVDVYRVKKPDRQDLRTPRGMCQEYVQVSWLSTVWERCQCLCKRHQTTMLTDWRGMSLGRYTHHAWDWEHALYESLGEFTKHNIQFVGRAGRTLDALSREIVRKILYGKSIRASAWLQDSENGAEGVLRDTHKQQESSEQQGERLLEKNKNQ